MNPSLQAINEKRIERTVKALKANRFDAHFIRNREELFAKLAELLQEGQSCSVGGSMTLFETGIIDYLKNGKYDYLDRYAKDADTEDIFHKALLCDVYFASSNAITEDGALYNMDGKGNRMAALVYGPKKVVIVAGVNKIVADIDAARMRNKMISAPANATRLNCATPCVPDGTCRDCRSPGRICCQELITYRQIVQDRITVLILPESLGY